MEVTLPEKLSMAAPQKVDATAMQMPVIRAGGIKWYTVYRLCYTRNKV